MPRADDPAIAGTMILYRRIPPKGDRATWDDNGQPTPSSQNFRDPEDELSVYMAHETTPEQALAGHTGFGLVYFTAGEVRELFGKAVILCRDDEEPANGHVLVCGNITNGMSKKLKNRAKWVEGRWPARLSPDQW
jgi:hypothetical protein